MTYANNKKKYAPSLVGIGWNIFSHINEVYGILVICESIAYLGRVSSI